MRPRYGRLTKRETALQRRAMDMHYAALSGRDPVFANDIAIPDAPKKRVRDPNGTPLENDVQKEIMAWLKADYRCAWRIRINSGAPGDTVYKTFYGLGRDELMSDVVGQLRGGRFFAIEVKREPWTKPTDDREVKQQTFHRNVRANGGIAFFATSLEEAKQKFDAALK